MLQFTQKNDDNITMNSGIAILLRIKILSWMLAATFLDF
jgi:hypothetical protein